MHQKKSSTEIRVTLFLLDESLTILTTMLCSDTFLVRRSVSDSTREVVVSALQCTGGLSQQLSVASRYVAGAWADVVYVRNTLPLSRR